MRITMKEINRILFPVLVLAAVVMALTRPKPFTKEQRMIIRQSDSVMYVTVWPEDSAILRMPCVDLTKAELKSKDLQTLMAKMLATVRAPQHDGVGIAAPQVGISKRIICLQRFDKDGGPFECYLNAHIDSLFGEIGKGPEGCPINLVKEDLYDAFIATAKEKFAAKFGHKPKVYDVVISDGARRVNS